MELSSGIAQQEQREQKQTSKRSGCPHRPPPIYHIRFYSRSLAMLALDIALRKLRYTNRFRTGNAPPHMATKWGRRATRKLIICMFRWFEPARHGVQRTPSSSQRQDR